MLRSTYKPAAAPPAPPPLAPGWTEHKAPSGHTYYYHAETKKSTYQRPAALPEPVQPQPPAYPDFTPNTFPGAPHQAGFPPQYQQQFPVPHHGGRGNFRGGHGYHQDRRRHQPEDRPKHKHAVPGCAPWVLVKTKLGRRFVHNPDTQESFWKFPPDVMKGVVEFDRVEREKRERKERGEPSDVDEEEAAAAELAAAEDREGSESRPSAVPVPVRKDYDSEEYEEVEVTDDEGAEDEDGPSKRQKTGEDGEEAVEFDEDDIAWQLEAMGQDYGLDPGEYGDGGDELPEGAEGLPLTEEDSKALFRDMLDDHGCNPFSTWDKVIDEGRIINDDRYTALTTMKARKETWEEWSRDKAQALKEQREKAAKKDPAIPYLAFLQKHATPKLYWPEFRRKFKKEAEMKDSKLLDKDREKWYREHINRLKLPESTRKSSPAITFGPNPK
ncbi:ff domain protein [Neofusicoccum parvum]|nr:ff domain protein [Neofusicoccum parvum]